MSKTHEQFVQEFENIYGNEFTVVGTYRGWNKPVDIIHNVCGTLFHRIPNNVLSRKTCSCPTCNEYVGRDIVTVGVDDINTTHPEVAWLMANNNDRYVYKAYSKNKTLFICPECGHQIEKAICNVTTNGLSCPYCSDGISYPNKFMARLLYMLNVPFQSEYKIKPYPYRYDFCFTHNHIGYIVEMDGAYGHGEVNMPTLTIEQQIEIDNYKDEIASQYNYHVIRIDCKYGNEDRYKYVSNSILNSKMSNMFELSEQLLYEVHMAIPNSMACCVANDWNNGNRSYDYFLNTYGISRCSVRRYVKQAIELGKIGCTYEEFLTIVRKASNKKLAKTKGSCVRCDQTGQVFYSISSAEKETGILNIGNCVRGKRHYAGQLPDGTKLTWTKITKQEYEQIKQQQEAQKCASF